MDKKKILIADNNSNFLKRLLEDNYQVINTDNAVSTCETILKDYDQFSLIILNMQIENMIKVLKILERKEIISHIPTIVITNDLSVETQQSYLNMGVIDILGYPYNFISTQIKIKNIIKLYSEKNNFEKVVQFQSKKINELNGMVKKKYEDIIKIFGILAESRGVNADKHVEKVKKFTELILNNLAQSDEKYAPLLKDIDIISAASCVHDIGKMFISDNILFKPDTLTIEERDVMKSHTTKGAELINNAFKDFDKKLFQYCYDVCRYHHERYDGQGYPEGLAGENIPVAAQIVSVAECFDALITDTVYRKSFSFSKAFDMVLNGECGMFSPKILNAFKSGEEELKKIILNADRNEMQ